MTAQIEQPRGEMLNRMLFHTRYQEENESLPEFANSLKGLLRVCCYAADCVLLDGLARDRFIAGILDKELQAFLTTQPSTISFDSVVELCIGLQNSLIKTEGLGKSDDKILLNEEPHQFLDTFSSDNDVIQDASNNTFDIKFQSDIVRGEENLDSLAFDGKTEGLLKSSTGIYRCYYCEYQTNERPSLEKHIAAIHGAEKLFKCDRCEFSTGWKSSLRKHQISAHNETSPCLYTCNKCNFSTKFSRVYRNHVMSLRINGKCDDCADDNNYPNQNQQTNEPIKCPHCSYTRNQRSKILNHIKSVHEDAKPFKCDQCKSSFKLKFRLTAHIKLSHGDGKVMILFIHYNQNYFYYFIIVLHR